MHRQHSIVHRTRWALVAILLLASLFYLFRLNAVSFWEDESWLAIATRDGLANVWTFATERGVHPPLYYLLFGLLRPFFGVSEFAMRWLSGLVALLGIACTYRLGADVLNRRAGLYAAWLAAGSLFLMYYARLARQYTFFYLLAAALIWVYWQWREHPQTRRWWLALVLVQAAALYTHYFSAFLGLTIFLHALLTLPRRRTLALLGALVLAGVLFLPWLPSIVVQLNSDLGEGLYYGVFDVPSLLQNYADRVTNVSLLLGGVLALLGVGALLRERRWLVGLLLLVWLVGTFGLVVAVNQTLFVWYIGRNMLYTLPGVLLLYGAGLAYVSRSRAGRFAAVLAASTFVVLGAATFSAFWPGTQDWRGVLQVLAREARPDDVIVLDGEPYTTDYYLRRFFGEPVPLVAMEDWLDAPVFGERLWFIDGDQVVEEAALALLPEGMVQTRRSVRWPIVVEFYQRSPQGPQVVYGGQLALGYRGAPSITVQPGTTLTVDVWWRAERVPDFNYSAGFLLLGEAGVIAQQDGNFDSGRLDAQVLPVGVWTPDSREIVIPPDAPPGRYTLRVTVYDWRDGARLPTPAPDDEELYPLLTVVVE